MFLGHALAVELPLFKLYQTLTQMQTGEREILTCLALYSWAENKETS